jgi:DtxR family manganese transport transcriptional regulator
MLLYEARICQSPLFMSFTSMTPRSSKAAGGSTAAIEKTAKSCLNGHETAAYQRRTRQQHAQERAQDYVEAIADLIAFCGEARATDLAKSLGVSHVTVIRTVERLQREGLVTTQPYRSIFLTDTGRKLAAKAKARHQTVIAFLEALGVSSSVARADAEGIEHHVSEETLAAFRKFLKSESR